MNCTKSAASTTAAPVSPVPVTLAITAGAPISCQPSIIRAQASGVSSDDFDSTAQPAASAGAASIRNRVIGKFQGVMMPTTG